MVYVVLALYIPRGVLSRIIWNVPKEGPVGPKRYSAEPKGLHQLACAEREICWGVMERHTLEVEGR